MADDVDGAQRLPGLEGEDRSLTGVNMIESVEEAVAKSVEDSGDPRVAFVPEGPYVVPVYRP